ncbi:6983_t:CDS:2, partial [Gigaspora rosea]
MQSELDLLRQENAKLLAENAQLRQIIEEKDSHAKLRDAELNTRIAELERSAKEHAESARQSQTENAELKGRVTNLEQEFKKRDLQFLTEEYEPTFQIDSDITSQKNTNISQSPASTIETHPDEENSTGSIGTKEIKQSSESQIPGSVKLKSLDEKEIDEFIDLENKERIIEPVSSKPLCNVKTVNNVHDREKIIPESAQNVPEKYIKDSSLVTEIVQGLLQGFLVNSIEGDNIEFINSEPSNSAPIELAHLLYQANKVINLRSEDKKLKDKTARGQIYNEMSTGISDEYLRKITRWHMVNRATYSADTISRLTNLQIQYIIDQVTSAQVGMTVSKTVNTVHDRTKTEVSTQAKANVLTKSQVSESERIECGASEIKVETLSESRQTVPFQYQNVIDTLYAPAKSQLKKKVLSETQVSPLPALQIGTTSISISKPIHDR